MTVVRSTRCSLSEMTGSKRATVRTVLAENGRETNVFIGRFWTRKWSKKELTKENLEVPKTWLSARLRKVAAREAIDMVRAARERDGKDAVTPQHKGKRMYVSCTIAHLNPATGATEFDAWLHLASIGRGIVLDLPVRFHRHYHRYANDPRARRLNSYIVTEDSVQLAFEVEVDPPRETGPDFGVDSGIRALATLSDGRQFGTDIVPMIERVNRCRHGSKGQQRARRALRQRIAEVAKEVVSLDPPPRLLVVEELTRLHQGTKRDRRLSRNMRRSLGAWTYRGWLDRLRRACATHRVRLESVPSAYTSQRCHVCGHTERGNRKGEGFRCRSCGFAGNADVNAARNLSIRFWGREPHLAGAYGPGFLPTGMG